MNITINFDSPEEEKETVMAVMLSGLTSKEGIQNFLQDNLVMCVRSILRRRSQESLNSLNKAKAKIKST